MCLIQVKQNKGKHYGIGYQVALKYSGNVFESIYTRTKKKSLEILEKRKITPVPNRTFHEYKDSYPAGFHVFKNIEDAKFYCSILNPYYNVQSRKTIIKVAYFGAKYKGMILYANITSLICDKIIVLEEVNH